MIKGHKRLPPLPIRHPDLVLEWHPTRNREYSPEQLTENSKYQAWWQCLQNADHVWQRTVSLRAKFESKCPFCTLEANNLAALFPEVARQWHPTLNKKLHPQDVKSGTERKVWWQCPLSDEHVYESTVYGRTIGGHGCPYCSGIKLDKKRSLKVRCPEVAKEWHPTRNGDLLSDGVSYGSKKYVWWRCIKDKSHEWQDPISKRTGNGSPCPFCNGYYLTNENRLSVCCPDIAAEWHPTKNRKLWMDLKGSFREVRNRRVPPLEREQNRRLRPSDVSIHSHEYAWWRCKVNKAHEWQAMVVDRVRHESGCPYCTNQKVGSDNNLAAVYPKVVKLWHPTRNLPLLPTQVVPGSNKKVWWRCSKSADHVWKTPVYNIIRSRNEGHRACPFCAGKRVCASNNLAAVCPEAAKLWHPTRNSFGPETVMPMSNKVVWWRCAESGQHEWKRSVSGVFEANKERGRSGCPFCWGRVASVDDNLAVRHPALAKLWWHPKLNLPLLPTQVRHGSGKKVWWRCPKSSKHVWQASICYTVKGFEEGNPHCPECAGSRARRKSSPAS